MIFTVPKLIRFHHCDPAGIVFYPQFYYLLHEAMEDFLSHIGFAEHRLIATGYGVPIVDMKTQFTAMCRHGDEVTIALALSKIGNSSIGMDYSITRQQVAVLKATAVVVYSRLVDAVPARLPDDLRQALLPYLHTSNETNPINLT